MQIEIQRLRQVTNLLFNHLLEQGVARVELTQDYYHVIDEDELYDFSKMPAINLAGQLSDDWIRLQEILDGTSDPLAHDLTYLAALLRYIGDEVVS